jgi:biopolymer transport protein ExbD
VRKGGSNPAIKLMMTPMVDLTFLLLVFFMLLPFRSLERQVGAYLPYGGHG